MCRRGMVQLNNTLGLDYVIEILAHMDSTSTVLYVGAKSFTSLQQRDPLPNGYT